MLRRKRCGSQYRVIRNKTAIRLNCSLMKADFFSISVSNATTVEYYYRPGVTVNCELRLNGKEVQASDKLYAGDYEVALNFINPFTGKVIDSELLSSAKFTLSVTNNDSNQVVSNKTGSITLVEGNVDINLKSIKKL